MSSRNIMQSKAENNIFRGWKNMLRHTRINLWNQFISKKQMQNKNKVFFDMVMSIDGFIAPEGMELSHANDPEYKQWQKKWMELMGWVFPQQFFRENLKLGSGGETGVDNEILKNTYYRTGVSIMGKTMFSLGEQMWPEEAPFHTPVFVLT